MESALNYTIIRFETFKTIFNSLNIKIMEQVTKLMVMRSNQKVSRTGQLNCFEKNNKIKYIYINNTIEINENDKILCDIEALLKNNVMAISKRKKLFYLFMEALQNISRYSANHHFCSFSSKIALIARNEKYYIKTSNLIENHKINALKNRLDHINNLSHEDLQTFYLSTLTNGGWNKNGGAGLGLIDMYRKSQNKLQYSFSLINSNYSSFNLEIMI